MGFQNPESGSICINDLELSGLITPWHKSIGYVPQSINLLDGTLRQNIAFGISDSEVNNALLISVIEAAQLNLFVDSIFFY